MSRSRHLRAGAPAWRAAFVVAVILALLWQAVVARAHFHLPHLAGQASVQGGPAQARLPAEIGLSDDEAACVLCRELAQTADYLASAPPAFAAPLASYAVVAAAIVLPWPRRHLPSGWRGRAPPFFSDRHQP